MLNPRLLAFAAVSALAISLAAWLLLRDNRQSEIYAARVQLARGAGLRTALRNNRKGGVTLLQLVTRIGLAVLRSGMLSNRTIRELEQTLVVSGFRAESALGMFIGSKIVLLSVFGAVAFLALPSHLPSIFRDLLIFCAAVVGLISPDKIVQGIRSRYRKRLENGLADMLDMLVICAQAGLGLEAALARLAAEIQFAHPTIGQELSLTVGEMQVMADSRGALQRLGERTDLPGLRRVTTTLVQSVQYGTPLSEAMRRLAGEMRQEALTAFEERAARLSVYLTVPMVLCILPCVIIVAGGPAVIGLFKLLSR